MQQRNDGDDGISAVLSSSKRREISRAIEQRETVPLARLTRDGTLRTVAVLAFAATTLDPQYHPSIDIPRLADDVAAHQTYDDPTWNADAKRELIGHSSECDVVFNGTGWVMHCDEDGSLTLVPDPSAAQQREQRLLDEWQAQQERDMSIPIMPPSLAYQPFDPVSARYESIASLMGL